MAGFWIMLFATDQVFTPGSVQTPIEIAYHLAAELSTAALLIASGATLLYSVPWARLLVGVSLGMLLYSVVNSPGFYANKGNLPMVAMFSVLTLLTVIAIVALFRVSS